MVPYEKKLSVLHCFTPHRNFQKHNDQH